MQGLCKQYMLVCRVCVNNICLFFLYRVYDCAQYMLVCRVYVTIYACMQGICKQYMLVCRVYVNNICLYAGYM